MYKKSLTLAIMAAIGLISGCSHDTNDGAQSDQAARSQQRSESIGYTHIAVQKMMAVQPVMEQNPLLSPQDTSNYLDTPSNEVKLVSTTPLSTFSVDVDTGSYANVRSYLNVGSMPPVDAIREEAFINYFDYDYATPTDKSQPFLVNTEIAPAPWNADKQLLRIAMKGYDIPKEARKPSNLVFLIDVSGSMSSPDKLPLLIKSLSLLTKSLNANDSVSLVTYAGTSSVVLKPTKGDQKQAILSALEQLTAGGGTNGESGLKLAYDQARQAFIKGGVNRVLLATDGDFNVGETSIESFKNYVAAQRDKGISLSTLGFGQGNYNDGLMEQVANIGDGNHAYIDTLHEAKKVLVRQMSGTLQSIAHDVKIQVEFNPANVKEYRLIGYQNRLLRDEDFNNDNVDAGEIGAGHAVTALYELTLQGQPGRVDDLKYQTQLAPATNELQQELLQVKVRYKLPEQKQSQLLKSVVLQSDVKSRFQQASQDFKFAASVAAFSQKLKQNGYVSDYLYSDIAQVAAENKGNDPYHYRGEFIRLVEMAASL